MRAPDGRSLSKRFGNRGDLMEMQRRTAGAAGRWRRHSDTHVSTHALARFVNAARPSFLLRQFIQTIDDVIARIVLC
jgi:hypothetical protein